MEMLPSLHENPAGVEGLRVFLILNELLYAMQRSGRVWSVEIAVKVAAAVQSLSTENLQVTGTLMETKSFFSLASFLFYYCCFLHLDWLLKKNTHLVFEST